MTIESSRVVSRLLEMYTAIRRLLNGGLATACHSDTCTDECQEQRTGDTGEGISRDAVGFELWIKRAVSRSVYFESRDADSYLIRITVARCCRYYIQGARKFVVVGRRRRTRSRGRRR